MYQSKKLESHHGLKNCLPVFEMETIMSSDQNKKHKEIKEYLWKTWVESERYGDFIVELTDHDIDGAKEIAVRRFENNRKSNTKNPKLSNEGQPTDYSRDILGACGELAAIKWLKDNGYEADYSKFVNVENKGGQTDDFDTDIVFKGETFSVEIKTTEKPINSKLIYPLHKGKRSKQPDIFLLVCQVDKSRHVIKGFTTSEQILSQIDDKLPTKAYSIHEKNLSHNLDEVIENIQNKKEEN